MGIVRKDRDIRLLTTEWKRSYLVSKSHTTKFFYKKSISNRNEKN